MRPISFNGYSLLNKPIFFRGGLPPQLAMLIIGVTVMVTIISLAIIPSLFALIPVFIIGFVLNKWAASIAKHNRLGDRDYMKSLAAYKQCPKEIRDNGLFKKVLTNEPRFKL